MEVRAMKKWPLIALLCGAVFLGATVFSGPIATAAQNVGTTSIGPLDNQGNVKVHEQGTADVKVTNSSLNVSVQQPQAIISGGAGIVAFVGSPVSGKHQASGLSIGMDDGVGSVQFEWVDESETFLSAMFIGPLLKGDADINISFDRQIGRAHV